MNQLKARLLRQQELAKGSSAQGGVPDFPLKPPRNLSEAPSAFDLDYSTAP